MTGFNLADFLQDNRSKIIEEWVGKIQREISDRYAQRPREEIVGTVTEAFDAYFHVLIHDDFSFINKFVDKLARMRLENGFPLSDVQKAFEFYGSIVISLLAKDSEIKTIDVFCGNLDKINRCLAYTIHCFSDYFQVMHERKNRLSAIGEAVAYVAHEIKNPLMLIGGFSNQILKAMEAHDEKILKKLQTIIDEVKRLEDFLKDIGRFAKELQPSKRTIHLNQIIRQLTGLFESECAVRGILVTLDLSPNCKNIVADPDQLEQVLLNLIKNAIEAMAEGGTLSVKSFLKQRKVYIEITDSGVGISKEDMERIGTPFFTTRKQGTGLGLSICQKIISAHQGRLTMFSEGHGKGAAVTVEMPFIEDLQDV